MEGWNELNVTLDALFIRNVGTQIRRRVAPIKAVCLRRRGNTRAVITGVGETLVKRLGDPGGWGWGGNRLWEQMCRPLPTVVPFPQRPCGRWWANCGLKTIPCACLSRVCCREARQRWRPCLHDQYLPPTHPEAAPAASLATIKKSLK